MKTLCIGLILFLSSVAPTFALREYAAVEDEIFSLQKDVVTHVVDALKIETSTGIEGSGNIHMKMKIASPSITGSIAVALDPFSTTSEKN